ncbi:MAG: hypothetical protein QXZ70_06230 [Candidatus Bathyarchaeia archaeon]
MKDEKSLAWLLPAAGLLVLFGWFLGRHGWDFLKINLGIGELAPPTATLSTSQQSSVVVVVTATPYPTLPATIAVVQPVSRVQLLTSEMTGQATRKVYDVTLASDEVIVGDAYDFQDKGYHCVVFIIRGPGKFRFTVLDGAWYRYSGVENDAQAEDLLQARVQYLQNHWFCKNVAFPVERIGR